MSKKITTSDAIKKCLAAYYFQEGRRVDMNVVRKIEKLINKLEKE